MKILLVEDNKGGAHFLKKGLKEAGYTVDHAENSRDGMFLVTSETYDAVIMDRMLPDGVDGIAVIAALREDGCATPILVLSELSDVEDRVHGLKSGCDDYIVKPFSISELLARLDAVLRRVQHYAVGSTLSVGDLHMDLLAHKVARAGRPLALQPREFKLLEFLMRHAGQVVTRTMLLENVWDYHFDPRTNVIDVHISKLRQKIETDAGLPLLKTIRNAGYMLSTDE